MTNDQALAEIARLQQLVGGTTGGMASLPPPPPLTGVGVGMAAPAPGHVGGAVNPLGLLVPVVLDTAAGEVTIMVQFAADHLNNPLGLLNALANMGWRVKAWKRQDAAGGGGFGANRYQGRPRY